MSGETSVLKRPVVEFAAKDLEVRTKRGFQFGSALFMKPLSQSFEQTEAQVLHGIAAGVESGELKVRAIQFEEVGK